MSDAELAALQVDAQVCLDRCDVPAALPIYVKLLEGLRASPNFGPSHEATLSCANNVGCLLLESDRLSEAEVLFREALAGKLALPGAPDALETGAHLGDALRAQGRPREAEDAYKAALAAATPAQMSSFGAINAHGGLCECARQDGRLLEAAGHARAALALRRTLLGDSHALTRRAFEDCAKLLKSAGLTQDANALLSSVYHGGAMGELLRSFQGLSSPLTNLMGGHPKGPFTQLPTQSKDDDILRTNPLIVKHGVDDTGDGGSGGSGSSRVINPLLMARGAGGPTGGAAAPAPSSWVKESDGKDTWFSRKGDPFDVVWQLPPGGLVVEDPLRKQRERKQHKKSGGSGGGGAIGGGDGLLSMLSPFGPAADRSDAHSPGAGSSGGESDAAKPTHWKSVQNNGSEKFQCVETGEIAWVLPPGGLLVVVSSRLLGSRGGGGGGVGRGRSGGGSSSSGGGGGMQLSSQSATPAAPPAAAWEQRSDEKDVWWVNTTTGELSWYAPPGAVAASLPASAPAPAAASPQQSVWRVVSDGKDKWYQCVTTPEEVAWELPPGAVLEGAQPQREGGGGNGGGRNGGGGGGGDGGGGSGGGDGAAISAAAVPSAAAALTSSLSRSSAGKAATLQPIKSTLQRAVSSRHELRVSFSPDL